MNNNALNTEWCLLQNQFDSYEKHSLYIKLVSVLVLVATLLANAPSIFIVLVLAVLWLQDAIWKTFQSRIEPRLLQLEQWISEQDEQDTNQSQLNQNRAFQFNSYYQRSAFTGIALIGEYLKQALRPTVAFPHIVLMAIFLANMFLN